MRGNGAKWPALVALLLVLGALTWWRHFSTPSNTGLAPAPQTIANKTLPVATETKQTVEQWLRSLASDLAVAPTADQKREVLSRLPQTNSALSTKDRSTGIRQFLDSRTDASTGQGFKIGGNGFLSEAPTLRAFLLDYLGRIDPAAAAEYARVILSSKNSPDEWAVALRSLALGDSSVGGRELLQQKVAEMLTNSAWQQNPSVGYLESFDVAVHLGGTNFIPTLTGLVRSLDNQAVAHAAYLTLDRLVIRDPAAVLEVLGADPDSMQGRELPRADYFARTDVRDPRQREIVEKYLLDPRIGSAELQQFADVFPNANFMISQNLLTTSPTPDPSALTARDAESLRVLQQWLADPRFTRLRPQLEKMKSRLEEFVRQASRPAQN